MSEWKSKAPHDFGRFGGQGERWDTIRADYITTEGHCVRFYLNNSGTSREDDLVAVVDLSTGNAVIATDEQVKPK